MQGLTSKTQYSFTSNLRGQQIPENEEITCTYKSSCSSSCSSEDNKEHDAFQYPTDNLGTSWGSYLQSGPPTRADAQKKVTRDHVEAINKELAQSGIPVVRRTKPTVVLVNPAPFTSSLQPTVEDTPTLHSPMPGNKVRNLKEIGSNQENWKFQNNGPIVPLTPQNSLLRELQKLLDTINTSYKEITKNGTNTDHLRTLMEVTEKTFCDLKQLVSEPISENGVEVLSSGVLLDVIQYLMEVLTTLVQQSQKISEDATSLHKSGRQLSKNQDQFFKEQYEIHQAIEHARMQLVREKHLFKAEMTDGKNNLRRLQQTLHEQKDIKLQKQTSKMGTVHKVMQGRNQLAALLHTQKEQAKLEKLLVRQQRDIQYIQQDLEKTKSELLSAQDHALKLEHRIVTHSQKVLPRKHKEHITTQTTTKRMGRKGYKTADSGLQGVLTAQRALDQEIVRIKRQLDEQQLRERLVSKQIETSYQSLKKRSVALRQQAAGIKGKTLYMPSDETKYDDDHRQQHRKRNKHAPEPQKQEVFKTKVRKKPTFAFSKQELVTLACFSDEEATDSVMEWLEMQGTLAN